jgi:hypothetical protein
MWRIGRAPNSIPVYSYIQQDATSHSLFISGNCSTYFGWYVHSSSGAHTTVSTASGICPTVTAICRYRGRAGTCLSVLWVTYANHSTLLQALWLCTGRKAHRGSRGITLLFHDHGTRRGEVSASSPGRTLPSGKIRYPLYRRLGGPQGWSGQVRKMSSPPEFDPRTVQAVASRYTD